MKRIFDLLFVTLLIPAFLIILCFMSIIIKVDSKGPILFWSNRIGKNNKLFSMPKFRTMHINTPLIETNKLLNDHLLIRHKHLQIFHQGLWPA